MVSLSDQMEPRVLWERVADHSETAPLAVKTGLSYSGPTRAKCGKLTRLLVANAAV